MEKAQSESFDGHVQSMTKSQCIHTCCGILGSTTNDMFAWATSEKLRRRKLERMTTETHPLPLGLNSQRKLKFFHCDKGYYRIWYF